MFPEASWRPAKSSTTPRFILTGLDLLGLPYTFSSCRLMFIMGVFGLFQLGLLIYEYSLKMVVKFSFVFIVIVSLFLVVEVSLVYWFSLFLLVKVLLALYGGDLIFSFDTHRLGLNFILAAFLSLFYYYEFFR